MKAKNIIWDADEDMIQVLPKEIDIPNTITDEEEISDFITNQYGFCHKGFEIVY